MASAPMKARDDNGAVDCRLDVYGTSNLKLAGTRLSVFSRLNASDRRETAIDLSICPNNLGTNTYSVALTVGEKAAQLIAQDLGITGF